MGGAVWGPNGIASEAIRKSNKSPEEKARGLAGLAANHGGTPQPSQPLPYASVTAGEQTSRRLNAVPTGRQLGTILTGPTRAGDKKALLGQ